MSTNSRYPGLWRGPIDHKASSVINAIFGDPINPTFSIKNGSSVFLIAPASNENLPRVDFINSLADAELFYGVVVGGDADGIYPESGPGLTTISNSAAFPGEGVVVCTQGRCIARVKVVVNGVNAGDPLTIDGVTDDSFILATTTGQVVVARSLATVPQQNNPNAVLMIPIDIQREGPLP